MTQEFYAIPNVEEEHLIRAVRECGFTEDSSMKNGFGAERAFVHIQRISEEHVANNSGYQWGFVLELKSSREEYESRHPVSRLLSNYKNAQVLDIPVISKRAS